MGTPAYGGQEIRGAARLHGPLLVVEGVRGVGYAEMVEVVGPAGRVRRGRVVEVGEDVAVVEIFAGTTGLSVAETTLRFSGQTFHLPVAEEMLGRVFNGLGVPRDGGPAPLATRWADVNGQPINPTARLYPHTAIQTGISAIDGMNTLVLGQKLPLFSGSGLPHDRLAAQIVRQAALPALLEEASVPFAIVFAAIGVKYDVAEYFRRSFAESGALLRVAMFLNLADDPPIERLLTPRLALTLAEYLAFEREMHVLVVLTDMTNYAEALRQLSGARGEVPGRKGYPGYLYSDLAALYERTGRIKGSRGSITQLPILTMPNDDVTHPVPDLTGYITEGQLVLSRSLWQQGLYPPVAVLPSLSRLMKDSIEAGHAHLAAQLYAAYARVQEVRSLAAVIGEKELGAADHRYLEFGAAFENEFVTQGERENRPLAHTLDLGWRLLSLLPTHELTRLSAAELAAYGEER